MLAKLIATLLQAKAGAISGVFLLGATGALISVSASSGVTTVTITEASPSPTTAVTRPVSSPELNVNAPASPKVAEKAAESPKVAADSTACSAEAQAIAFQVQRVNTAFSGFHSKLEALRKDHSKDTVKATDEKLKATRKAAVKAIHATRTCKDDDEDETKATSSEDTDKDESKDEDKDEDTDDQKTTTTTPPTGGLTAEAIATAAITQMESDFKAAEASKTTADAKKPEAKKPEAKKPETKPGEGEHRD